MYFVRISDEMVIWEHEYKSDKKEWTKPIQHKIPFWNNPITIIDARKNKDKVCFMRQSTESYHTEIMKSNIQKTFRRNMVTQCLSTTQQLLRQDTNEALRRLPVIMLEDGQLHHESYSLVVWLMAAHSKGYRLQQKDEQLILSAVATSLSSTNRYSLHIESNNDISKHGYSIVLRSIFGGMKGDTDFLLRLAKRVDQLDTLPEWVQEPAFPSFSVEQIIPEAIDFHCCPSIIDFCKEKTNMTKELIHEAIWWNWSSVTDREIVEDIEENNRQEKQCMVTKSNAMRLYSLFNMYAESKIKWMYSQKKKVLVQARLPAAFTKSGIQNI